MQQLFVDRSNSCLRYQLSRGRSPVKALLFKLTCWVNAAALIGTGLLGVIAPDRAMDVMTGLERPWDPDVLSLMRMHNGADFGLGIGLVLVSLRPERSFAALVLCLFANLAHGLVHIIDEAQGHHHLE